MTGAFQDYSNLNVWKSVCASRGQGRGLAGDGVLGQQACVEIVQSHSGHHHQ